MKFSDGYWLLREGVGVFHPAVVHCVTATEDTLTVLAPTVAPRDRSEMHDLVALTIELSSPTVDVIRVRMTHHAGGREPGPSFPVFPGDAPDVRVEVDDSVASLRSGRLTAQIHRTGPWSLDFVADGRTLTASDAKSMAAIEWPGHGGHGDDGHEVGHFMVEALSLGVGEHVYGLGERFGPFVKNGQSIDMWNRDGGTGSEQAYKNVPFYLTDAGYGVFVNEPGKVEFEVATERVDRVGFSVAGQSLEYLVIYGPSPKEVLERFTGLIGRPALPPAWSFGLWLSTSFTTDYDEATVTHFVEGMAERDIPLSVFHFDSFWMREFQWVDFSWDERVFPDPAGMLARLHGRGLRICVWINPYIAQASPLFGEASAAGYLVRRPNGDTWQSDQWQPGMGIVDFTNPDARAWYSSKLAALLDQGVDCFKTDFGERIPTDVVWHDGSDPERMHNFYPYLYNQTVFELLRERRGQGEAVVFARSATACSWLFPVHWGGDCESTFPSMADTLRGGLSLGLSGFGFWSHDIGGFEGTPPPAVYQRWAQFGLLSSHSRLHGSNSYRVPWLVDDQSVEVVTVFARLKCRLMPYLYRAAVEASRSGVPMMRAMLLEFPDDPTAAFLDRQYMLGESLLVAPIFAADGQVTYYIPAGRWTHLISGATLRGPGWIRERHDVSSLPLLVRPGSVIAMGARSDRADYDFADGVTLRAYELAEGVKVLVAVPDVRGGTDSVFEVTGTAGGVVAERAQGSKSWRLLLANAGSVLEVMGGTAESVPEGMLVTAAAGSHRIEIRLSG
ncbi:MAG: alpha-xylosidase [Candidatus Limnocylindrales bacterium]